MPLNTSFPPRHYQHILNNEDWDACGRRQLSDFIGKDEILEFDAPKNPPVSIVIVLHNKAHLSLLCLKAIRDAADVPYELVIIDNHSVDDTGILLDRCSGAGITRNSENVGFGPACNQGVEQCSGEFVLFLNNDALLQHGALSAALRNFQDKSVGAVGGKILLANGDLQEAGSIIWADGSALGYGRGDKPFQFKYEFRRLVDFCSGAFLFTPRRLFRELGGFDDRYAPAYYEDTDYCMKVWQAGLTVVYEPEAMVRHYESASSGGNEHARLHMAAKQDLFIQKWHKTLLRHQAPSVDTVVRSRIASQSKALRVLFVDDKIPHRNLGAGFPRSNDILRLLARQGHHITCVSFRFGLASPEIEYEDIPRDVELLAYPGNESEFYRDYLRVADVVWISRPHNLELFLDHLIALGDRCPKLVYDAEAIFAQRERLWVEVTGRQLQSSILDARLKKELALPQAADAVVVVSTRDRNTMMQSCTAPVHVLGYCMHARPTMRPFATRQGFLFVGAIHSRDTPNADSMRYFCQRIWPEVHRRTGATLTIAGFGTDRHLEEIAGAGIDILGSFSDPVPFYDRARVVIVPTRYAAGIPIKAHEAAAYGVPLVVSALIGHQLDWRHNRELLIAGRDEEFVECCCRLHADRELWQEIRLNALTRVLRDLDPIAFADDVRAVLDSVTGGGRSRSACA